MLATFDLAGHVIGIIVNTDLTDQLLDEVILEIKARLEQYEQVNVYLELERGHEISFKALLKGINFKYLNADLFNKIAIVTDSIWFQKAVNVSDIFLNVEVRTYDIKDRLNAIQWISI
ncbi:STAS/SEC14 domain-containing protein [Christiangramia portivictoriae]|uniref:STAS/SEC14 domain-containing protein n=1 Tax=Christiangramia portivictoriae TaxID=326069 RepID=UPI0004283F0E|nr:STAS/SEC14 domain-containing protein [Christiangramia portivictoriae]